VFRVSPQFLALKFVTGVMDLPTPHPKAVNTENISTMLFLKTQVVLFAILTLDRNVMRGVNIMTISLLLLVSSLAMLLGEEAFATIGITNMTQTEPPSGLAPSQNISSTIPMPLERLTMSAQFAPDGRYPPGSGYYRMTALSLSPNSNLCPDNNCQFEFEDGELSPNTSTGGYLLGGILHVSTQQNRGNDTNLYNVEGELDRVQALEQQDNVTDFLTGELRVGAGTGSFVDDFVYRILNGSLTLLPGGAVLTLQGERNLTSGVQQQLSSPNLTTLQQPGNLTTLQQPGNLTTLQQPGNLTTLQQLLEPPMIEQTPSQTPLSPLQQLTTAPPTAAPPTTSSSDPFSQTSEVLGTQQQQQQQQLFPSSPLTSTPGAIPSQSSYYPPSSTTFPPTIYPPSGTTYPSTGYPPVGTYPGTGYPMAAAGGIGGVSTSSQIIAPWFPSLPATNCGGTFVMTVEGIPTGGNGNDNDKITPSDENDDNGDNGDNDDKQYSGKSNRRLAVQINSDNGQIITGQQQDAIFGQIFQGQKNIDQNKANDFDIRSIFNDCQVSMFSKLD
jgi:hypothetical protein